MFFRKHRKQNSKVNNKEILTNGSGDTAPFKNQKYFFKLLLPSELQPDQNSATAEMIKTINDKETSPENQLATTYPYASFQTTNELFIAFRNHSNATDQKNIYVTLELETWDEKKKKVINFVTFDKMEINFHFQNLLKNIFEEVVNDNSAALDTDMMIEFLTDLKYEYITNTGSSADTLPEVPTEQSILSQDYYNAKMPEHTAVSTSVDTDSVEVKEITAPDTTDEIVKKEKPTIDENSNKKQQPNSVDHSESVAPYLKQENIGSRSDYTDIIDDLKNKAINETSILREITISAPQFTISSDVTAAKPYDPNYVAYMLKLRREQYNTQLKNAATQLNTDAENKVLQLQQAAEKFFNDALNDIQEKNAVKTDEVKKSIRKKTLTAKNDENDLESKKLEIQFNNERNLIEQEYKAKLANIKNNEELAKQRLDHQLADKYSTIESEKVTQALKQEKKESQQRIIAELKPAAEQLNSKLSIQYNNIRDHIEKTLQAAFDKLQDKLPEYESTLQAQYLNAVETHAIEQRAHDIGLQNKQVSDSNQQLLENNKRLMEEKLKVDKELKNLNEQFTQLEQELNKSNNHNDEHNLQLVKKVNSLKEAVEVKQRKQRKINKEIVGLSVIIGALGIGTGATYAVNKNNELNHLKTENTTLKAAAKVNKPKSQLLEKKKSKESQTGKVKQKHKNQSDISNYNLPPKASKLIIQGKYKQAVELFPDYVNEIEQTAFQKGNLDGIKAANQTGKSTFGTLDEAILNGSHNLIIAAYENSGKPQLNSAVRTNEVGRAYLKRNQYNTRANDYMNAVYVYQNNHDNGTALLANIRYFEVHHSLND